MYGYNGYDSEVFIPVFGLFLLRYGALEATGLKNEMCGEHAMEKQPGFVVSGKDANCSKRWVVLPHGHIRVFCDFFFTLNIPKVKRKFCWKKDVKRLQL